MNPHPFKPATAYKPGPGFPHEVDSVADWCNEMDPPDFPITPDTKICGKTADDEVHSDRELWESLK